MSPFDVLHARAAQVRRSDAAPMSPEVVCPRAARSDPPASKHRRVGMWRARPPCFRVRGGERDACGEAECRPSKHGQRCSTRDHGFPATATPLPAACPTRMPPSWAATTRNADVRERILPAAAEKGYKVDARGGLPMPSGGLDFAPHRFSTTAVPERRRVPYWREVFGRKLVRVDIEPRSSDSLEAEAEIRSLPGFRSTSFVSAAAHLERPTHMLADG